MYAKTIIESSFPIAWQKAVGFVLNGPERRIIGGGSERKHILDSQVTFILDKNAIAEIMNDHWHPSDPFCTPNTVREYRREYEANFKHDFDYIYRDRLEKFNHEINQIDALRLGLQTQIFEDISSNRNIAFLYDPTIDTFSTLSKPCWNDVMVRLEYGNKCSVHTTFRSHDLCAWEANMLAIVPFVYREIVMPCGCVIDEWHEHNKSLHIYKSDVQQLSNIKTVYRHPRLTTLQAEYNDMVA